MAEEILLLKIKSDLGQSLKNFDKLKKAIEAPVNGLGDLGRQSAAAKKLLREITQGAGQSFNELVTAISGAAEGTQEFNKASEEITQTQTQLKAVISSNQDAVKEFNRNLRLGESAGGYYRELEEQIKKLKLQYRGLSEEQIKGDFGADLAQNIAKIDTELKQLDAGIGEYGRSVGDYKNSIELALAEYRTLPEISADLKIQNAELEKLTQEQRSLRAQINATGKSFDDMTAAEKKANRELTDLLLSNKKRADDLERAINDGNNSLRDLAKNATFAQRAFASLAGTFGALTLDRIVDFGVDKIRDAVTLYSEYTLQLGKLNAVTGATAAQQDLLRQSSDELALTTQFTNSQIVQLQIEYAKLGFKPEEIVAATGATQNLAKAFGDDLGQTATVVAATLNSYNLEASESGRIADILGTAFANSALDLTKFETSIGTVLPVAKTFDLELEGVVGILGQFSNAGFDASSGATALRNILLNLADEGGGLAQALGRPITSIDELLPALKQLSDSGLDLAGALDLTDKRSVSAFSNLLNNTEGVNELTESLRNSAGAAEALGKATEDNLSGDLAKLVSTIQGNVIKAFTELDGTIRGFVQFLISSIQVFGSFIALLNRNRDVIGALVVAYTALNAKLILTTIANSRFVTSILASNASLLAQRVAFGVAIVASNLYNVAMGLLTGNITRAIVAFNSLKVSLLSNPFTAVLVALGALIPLFIAFREQAREIELQTTRIGDAAAVTSKKTAALTNSINEERIAGGILLETIKKNLIARKDTSKLVEEFNSKYGKYIGNIDGENLSVQSLDQARQSLNKTLQQEAIVRGRASRLGELGDELVAQQIETVKLEEKLKSLNEEKERGAQRGYFELNIDSEIVFLQREIDAANEKQETLNKSIEETDAIFNKLGETLNIDTSQAIADAQAGVTGLAQQAEFATRKATSLSAKLGDVNELSADADLDLALVKELEKANKEAALLNKQLELSRQLSEFEGDFLASQILQDEIEQTKKELEALGVVSGATTQAVAGATVNTTAAAADTATQAVTKSTNAQKKLIEDTIPFFKDQISKLNSELDNLGIADTEQAFEIKAKIALAENAIEEIEQAFDFSVQPIEIDLEADAALELINLTNESIAEIELGLTEIEETEKALSRVAQTAIFQKRLEQELQDKQAEALKEELSLRQQITDNANDDSISSQVRLSRQQVLLRQLADLEKQKERDVLEFTLKSVEASSEEKKKAALDLAALDQKLAEEQRTRDDETTQRRKDNQQQIVDAIIEAASQISDTLFDIANTKAEQQKEKDLEDAELRNETEIERLNALEEKQIEGAEGNEERIARIKANFDKQRLLADQKYDNEKEKIERKAFERNKRFAIAQAIINGALAITAILTVPDATLGIASAIQIALATLTTSLQIATIAAQQFGLGGVLQDVYSDAKYAKGGFLKYGKSHAQGGIPAVNRNGQVVAEVEKNESINNVKSTSAYYKYYSVMNERYGGVRFPNAPSVNSKEGQELLTRIEGGKPKFQRGGFFGSIPRANVPKYLEGGVITQSTSNLTSDTAQEKIILALNGNLELTDALIGEIRDMKQELINYSTYEQTRRKTADVLDEQTAELAANG